MHVLGDAVDRITHAPQPPMRNELRHVREPGGNEASRSIPKTLATKCMGCVKKRSSPFCLSCCCGLSILCCGMVCLILFIFSSSQYGILLMPGLGLFIIGVTATAVSEWYCRSKRQAEQFNAQRSDRNEQVLDRRAPNLRDLPPSYSALYHTQRTLPIAVAYDFSSSISFTSNSFRIPDETEQNNDRLPPYSEVA